MFISDKPHDKCYHCMFAQLYKCYLKSRSFTYKTEIESQMEKTNLCLPEGKERGGINSEIAINIYTGGENATHSSIFAVRTP